MNSMRTITTICAVVMALGIVVAACNRGSVPQAEQKVVDRSAEEPQIYKSAIEYWLKVAELPRKPNKLVIDESTSALRVCDGEEEDECLKELPGYLKKEMSGKLLDETLQDWRIQNQKSRRLESALPALSMPVIFLSKEQKEEIFPKLWWPGFYKRYPESQGSMTLSRVGMNKAGTQALVYLGNQSEGKWGAGYLILLTKKPERWQVEKMTMIWIS